MSRRAGDDDPIELHLPDGGHVVVSFEDRATAETDVGDVLVDALLHVDGSEREIERAVRARAGDLGFGCSSSTTERHTVIVIEQPDGRPR